MVLPLLLCALWLGPQQTPSNLQAEKVVAAAIAKMGGDLYLQVNQRSGNGHLYTFNSSGQLSNPGTRFWAFYRFPFDERIELTKKRNVIYIYADGKGYEITYKGVAPMLRRQLRQYQILAHHSLDLILKTWARDPQTLMLDQGLTSFDQEQVESVFFTTPSGDSATVDFSLTTHLPLRVRWRQNDPETGGHYIDSVIYGNWARVGGIETPFSLDHYEGPQRVDQRYFDHVTFAPFPDSLFLPKPLH
ncbi:MAG TPA: hypothetical protein VMV31_14435 [Terriglobales bacterium]|nr:hypothetical protein [Terriglobales bacterium]